MASSVPDGPDAPACAAMRRGRQVGRRRIGASGAQHVAARSVNRASRGRYAGQAVLTARVPARGVNQGATGDETLNRMQWARTAGGASDETSTAQEYDSNGNLPAMTLSSPSSAAGFGRFFGSAPPKTVLRNPAQRVFHS